MNDFLNIEKYHLYLTSSVNYILYVIWIDISVQFEYSKSYVDTKWRWLKFERIIKILRYDKR